MILGGVRLDENRGVFQVRLDAETTEDVHDLVRAANSAIAPVVTFGHISAKLTYCWFDIPLRKNADTNSIGNDVKRRK